MRRQDKVYIQANSSPASVSFADLCYLIEAVGFEQRGPQRGSHIIYKHPKIKDKFDAMINVQNVDGKAKAYQVGIVIKIIDKYNLLSEED